jgi:hypothetical protein
MDRIKRHRDRIRKAKKAREERSRKDRSDLLEAIGLSFSSFMWMS